MIRFGGGSHHAGYGLECQPAAMEDGWRGQRFAPDFIPARTPPHLRKLHTVINEGTGPQPPNPTDFLIAMDYVLADAGETPVEKEHPGVLLPQPGGTTVYADESATIGGFDCNTATKDWTIELAGDVPDDAWDQTDVNRPLNKVLFTLMKSGVPWATVEIVQNGVYSPGALCLRFSNGGTHTLAGNTDSPFCFLRGWQVLVTLRHKSGGQWSIFASVGGSTVAKAVELSGPEVLPEVLVPVTTPTRTSSPCSGMGAASGRAKAGRTSRSLIPCGHLECCTRKTCSRRRGCEQEFSREIVVILLDKR